MVSLKGKVVLITGASAGIGEACALAFAAQGCKLILGARRSDRLADLAGRIRVGYDVDVLPLYMDVTDFDGLSESIGALDERWSEIDILINNAGMAYGLDLVQDVSVEGFNAMIDTNIKGVFFVTHLVLPGMLKRDRGHVFNIGSIAGRSVYPKGNIYCATKAAVDAFTQSIRIDAVGTNVRVTLIEPGFTETEFAMVRYQGDEEKAAATYRGLDCLRGEDVADLLVYCATRPPHVNIGDVMLTPTHQATVRELVRKAP